MGEGIHRHKLVGDWPQQARSLVAEFGEDRVNKVSLDLFGFPARMITSAAEAAKLSKELKHG